HDQIKVALVFRKVAKGNPKWQKMPMHFIHNDRWEGSFTPEAGGFYEYSIEAWVDHFSTWQLGLDKKFEAKQDIGVELLQGIAFLGQPLDNAPKGRAKELTKALNVLKYNLNEAKTLSSALSENMPMLMAAF